MKLSPDVKDDSHATTAVTLGRAFASLLHDQSASLCELRSWDQTGAGQSDDCVVGQFSVPFEAHRIE